MRFLARGGAALMVCILLVVSCTASDGSQVATGPIATTPPLAIPPVLRQPDTVAVSGQPVPTTAPVQTPVVESAEATPLSLDPDLAPTVAPTAVALPDPAPATPVTNTPVPATPAPATPAPAVTSEPAAVSPAAPTSAPGSGISLGDFEVVNLVTGANQNISELSPTGPAVLWFWAPSCQLCQIEAPGIVQFARDNPTITVVGVGAGTVSNGDSLDGAYAFMNRFDAHNAGMTMLYDVSFQSWRTFGVSTHPWVILIDDRGQIVFSQRGQVDLTGVPELLGA